jgi:nucleoside-diphosphate-sugar epimerase
VLVTGGAGFIGSWLCDVLVGLGADVTDVDDLPTGRIKNIDHLTKNPLFKFVESDVCAFGSKEKFDFIWYGKFILARVLGFAVLVLFEGSFLVFSAVYARLGKAFR